jgi:polyferredoxin
MPKKYGIAIANETVTMSLTNALAGRLWCGFACPQTV